MFASAQARLLLLAALVGLSTAAVLEQREVNGCGPDKPSTPAATTTTLPESCTFRPTQTDWATTGCAIPCKPTGYCYADEALTLRCGCPSMRVSPTTTTICPTQTGCVQCTSAWGIAIVTESPCPTVTGTA